MENKPKDEEKQRLQASDKRGGSQAPLGLGETDIFSYPATNLNGILMMSMMSRCQQINGKTLTDGGKEQSIGHRTILMKAVSDKKEKDEGKTENPAV
ncbi:hypothetical protein RB195_002588 [Necator americanus]|uniref:Uncharacterized protein n=1 Tax=Necator americanus TaxID=51031 RepID=A0ABR1DJQ9_NECAM